MLLPCASLIHLLARCILHVLNEASVGSTLPFEHTGGAEEAEAAYAEACHAILHLQLERHHHTQPYISKKDGRSKWAMIEMSPITVSSCTGPA